MSRLDEVKSWMRWWGWDQAAGVKRDVDGRTVARWKDATFDTDVEKAIEIEDGSRPKKHSSHEQ